MYEPKLIESSEEYEVWECNGKKLYHEKRYSRTLKRYSSGTYRFNGDYYVVNQNSWNVMYTINGECYYTKDYISLMEWCIKVGFTLRGNDAI